MTIVYNTRVYIMSVSIVQVDSKGFLTMVFRTVNEVSSF
jgi:hypothetical protein